MGLAGQRSTAAAPALTPAQARVRARAPTAPAPAAASTSYAQHPGKRRNPHSSEASAYRRCCARVGSGFGFGSGSGSGSGRNEGAGVGPGAGAGTLRSGGLAGPGAQERVSAVKRKDGVCQVSDLRRAPMAICAAGLWHDIALHRERSPRMGPASRTLSRKAVAASRAKGPLRAYETRRALAAPGSSRAPALSPRCPSRHTASPGAPCL